MISYLKGTVKMIRESYLTLLVGGVGYKVSTTKDTLTHVHADDAISLYTHLVVREDVLDLFGFISDEELRFFELLLTVSGIGPKSALGILDTASIETIQSAVINNNPSYLTSVSGIGKKTAEKIVMGLKDKMNIESLGDVAVFKADVEALEAMRSLGYSAQEARDALREVPQTVLGSNDRLREALRLLGSKHT